MRLKNQGCLETLPFSLSCVGWVCDALTPKDLPVPIKAISEKKDAG